MKRIFTIVKQYHAVYNIIDRCKLESWFEEFDRDGASLLKGFRSNTNSLTHHLSLTLLICAQGCFIVV